MILSNEILGFVAVAIGLMGNIPYIVGILKGRIKPHVFSWTIWTLLTGIGSAAMWFDGAGPGMWVMFVTFVVCFITAILALKVGQKSDIARTDWVAFIAVLLAIPLWYATKDPLAAVIIISLIDLVSTYPSIRKGYVKPWDEGLSAYAFANLKFVISLFALDHISLTTTLYPVSVVIINFILIFVVLIRRRFIPRPVIAS